MPIVPTLNYEARLPNVQITPRNLGADTAAAARVGESFSNLAGTLDAKLDKIARENEANEVARHKVLINDHFAQEKEKYQSRKGTESAESMNDYNAGYGDFRSGYLENIKSDNVKMQVANTLDAESSFFKGQLGSYMVKERNRYQKVTLKNLENSAQKNLQGEFNSNKIDLAIANTVDTFATQADRSEEDIIAYQNQITDSFYINHAGNMQQESPESYIQYYQANIDKFDDVISIEAATKLERFFDVAVKQAALNDKKNKSESSQKIEHDLKQKAMNVATLTDIQKARTEASSAWDDGNGMLKANAKIAIDRTLNKAEDKINKQVRLRDIFDGNELNYKPAEMRNAVNLKYDEMVASFTPDTPSGERQDKIVSIVTKRGMMPDGLANRFSTAALDNDPANAFELSRILTKVKATNPNMVGDFRINKIKDLQVASYWSALSKRIQARGNPTAETIKEDMKFIKDNVYGTDDFNRKTLIKKFRKDVSGKAKFEKAADEAEKLFHAIRIDVETEGKAVDWLLSTGANYVGLSDIKVPEQLINDFVVLTQQAYVHTGGDYNDAVEAASLVMTDKIRNWVENINKPAPEPKPVIKREQSAARPKKQTITKEEADKAYSTTMSDNVSFQDKLKAHQLLQEFYGDTGYE